MKGCNAEDVLVKYGDWFEVYSEDNLFLGSYRATSDMCGIMLSRYLDWKLDGVDHENYKIKKVRNKK